MKYILIADTPQSLPFAVSVDEESIESALIKTADIEKERGYMNAFFLIDIESGDVKRLYRDGDSWAANETAFRSDLGVATPDEYFKEDQS
jgi:hypothetical protein